MKIRLRTQGVAVTALLCLGAPLGFSQSVVTASAISESQPPARPTSERSSSPPADESIESPRERGRILVKRNPIASEYQAVGDFGESPGADADAEGVDYRTYFPRLNPLDIRSDNVVVGYSINYNSLSEAAKSGAEASFGRRLHESGRWALSGQLRSSGSERQIEHYEALWKHRALGSPGEAGFALDRPRYSVDTIYTRNNVATLQLGYAPADNHRLYLKTFYQDYVDNFYRNRLELQLGAADISETIRSTESPDTIVSATLEDARVRRYYGDTDNQRTRQHIVLGGSYEGSEWEIDYSVYAHKWDLDSLWYNWNFNEQGLAVSYDARDPNLPDIHSLDGIELADVSRATFGSLRVHDTFTRDRDVAFRIDAERVAQKGDREIWIQTGALFRRKTRENGEDRSVYLPSLENRLTLTEIASQEGPATIIRDRFVPQAGLDRRLGRQNLLEQPEKFAYSAFLSRIESAPESYDAEEGVAGAYALAYSALGNWTIEAGGRWEHTTTATRGTVVIPELVDTPGEGALIETIADPVDGRLNLVKDLDATSSYTNFLPSVEVSRSLGERSKLRASWYQLLMRPQYYNIVSYRRIGIPTQSISEGNPLLRPTEIDMLRLAWTKSAPWLGEVSLEAYYISIDSFFYGAVSSETLLESGRPVLYRVSRIENGDTGSIRGAGLQWTRALDRLPLFDSGLVTIAYTYSDSEATVATRPGEKLPVPERSDHLIKASLTGLIGPVKAELEVAYQSEALDDVGSGRDYDIYRGSVLGIGFNGSYAISESMTIYLNLLNLSDDPERAYEGDPHRVTRSQYSSWSAIAGFRQRF